MSVTISPDDALSITTATKRIRDALCTMQMMDGGFYEDEASAAQDELDLLERLVTGDVTT